MSSPCYDTPKSRIKKKIDGKQNEVSNCFCLGAAADVRHFHHFLFLRPPLHKNAKEGGDARRI
jgi:hypothetical protein